MATPPLLSSILKSLVAPLVRVGLSKAKPSLERRKVVAGKPLDLASLEQKLEQVLNILSRRDFSSLDGLKNSGLAFLSNIDPIYSKPFIQEWLNHRETRDLLICKAIDALLEKDETAHDDALSQSYSAYSGEVASAATYAINTTHEYLIRSISALLDGQTKLTIQLDNKRTEHISDEVHSMSASIGRQLNGIAEYISFENQNIRTQPIIDREAHAAIAYARHRQHFGEVDSFEEFLTLAERAKDGDLASASASVRTLIFREIAREYFGKKDTAKGIEWLDAAKKLSPNENYSLENIRHTVSAGEVDKALAEAKVIDSDNAKAFTLMLLLNYRDNSTAISYYNASIKNPSNLTGDKLLNFAIKQCEVGDFDFALELLANVTDKQIEDCPAILSIRALVKTTMSRGPIGSNSIFASFPIHPKLIKFNDTPEKVQLRLSAIEDMDCFLNRYALPLNIPKYQSFIEEMKLWLELEHPDENIRNSHRAKFNESIRDTKFAVRYSRLAFEYGQYVDMRQMEDYLGLQKSMGDLTFDEVMAAFLLAIRQDTPQVALSRLEEDEENIATFLPKEGFISLKAELLVKCGRRHDSESYINANTDVIGQDKADALKAILFDENTDDPIAAYREAFDLTKGDSERRMLIKALNDNQHYIEAAEHIDYFFSKNPSYGEAEEILFLLINSGEYTKAKDFLSRQVVQSLIAGNPNLRSLSAWVAYFNGNIQEATAILEDLPKERDPKDNNYRLAILIAQETGNWEDALGELVYAHQNRDSLSTAELIRYASLGWLVQCPKQQIVDLLTTAAPKADKEKDAYALIRLYSLAIRLEDASLESITGYALRRAQELSGADGPLKAAPIQDLKTWLEQSREQESYIAEQVALGLMPLSVAIHPGNGALCNVVSGQMIRNEEQYDWRKKHYLPLFAGNQERAIPEGIKNVAFDRSSLIVLSHLGVLGKALDSFEHVLIANSCMSEFLEELEKIRFHQASQVAEANRIQRFIAEQKIKIAPNFTDPIDYDVPDGLNRDLSKFIAQAKSYDGYVVLAKDEYKITSFLEEKVDLSGLEDHLVSLTAIANFLLNEKLMTEAELEQINAQHRESILTDKSDKKITRNTFLFLERYSLDCLMRYGLLGKILLVNKNVYIQKETQLHETGLLNYIDQQKRVEGIVEIIRNEVKSRIESGKIKFVARNKESDESKNSSLMILLANNEEYDVLIVDDRYLNKFNKTPSQLMLSSLEIVSNLYKNTVLSEQDFFNSLQKLRKSGILFVPFNKKELIDAATQSYCQKNKSKELIEIINYLCFIGKSSIIKYPEEQHFIIDGIRTCAQAIKDIWKEELDPDAAYQKSKYIATLIDNFYFCVPTNDRDICIYAHDNISTAIMSMLADVDFSNEFHKIEKYFTFLNENIIKDDNYLKKYIFPRIGKMFTGIVDDVAQSIHSQHSDYALNSIAKACVARIHPQIQTVMLEDDDFLQKYTFGNNTIQICGRAVNYEEFMGYARNIANNSQTKLHDTDGQELNIAASKIPDGTIQLKLDSIVSELKAGCILSSSKKVREKVLNNIKGEYEFSYKIHKKWKKRIATVLRNSEYWDLIDDIAMLPTVVLDEIDKAISSTHALDFKHCVPSVDETLLALFGEPVQENIDAFFDAVASRQGKLLLKNIDTAVFQIGPGALIPSKRLLDIYISKGSRLTEKALADCLKRYNDPFSLMLIFDICAAQSQKDEAYVSLGRSIIHKVFEVEPSKEFIDFEICLHFVLPMFLEQSALAGYPIFFRRLCAWGWAGHISRILSHYDFDRASTLTNLKEAQRENFLFTGLVDRQSSPYWHPHYISSKYLSGFLYNRMVASLATFCPETVPKEWDDILRDVGRADDVSTARVYSLCPTPFTGLSKHYNEPQIIEGVSERIDKNFLERSKCEFLLSTASIANISKFTPSNIEHIKTSLISLKENLEKISDDDFLSIIEALSHVATINRDEELAQLIVDWFIIRIVELDKKEEFMAVYAILSTFPTYQDQDQACNFLRDKLTAIAWVSNSKELIERCLYTLKLIEETFPEFRPYLLKSQSIFTLGYYAN